VTNKRGLATLWMVAALAACGGGAMVTGPSADSPDGTVANEAGPDTAGETASRDLPDGSVCSPGTVQCLGAMLETCAADGSSWGSVTCGAGTTCTTKGCQANPACKPGTVTCDAQGRLQTCLDDGSGNGPGVDCPGGGTCAGGTCVTPTCTAGDTQCTTTALLVCAGTPPAWTTHACGAKQVCFQGDCVDCFNDTQCTAPLVCTDGHCAMPPLTIVTKDLPDGQIGTAYTTTLQGTGGVTPYTWGTVKALPDGLTLAPATGTISGTPTTAGTYPVEFSLTDAGGGTVTASMDLVIHDKGLTITSKSPLPDGTNGTAYTPFTFQALGGTAPLSWSVTAGALPAGLVLSWDGTLAGTPTGYGAASFTIRVVDSSNPLQSATKDFTMTIKVAQLQITGSQMFNLYITKAVVLPLITVVTDIPIPYSTQLEATGGVTPYHWTVGQMNGLIQMLIPKAGIPDGLTLSDAGVLSGSVTDTSTVVSITIPMTSYTLTGYFFQAQVTDTENPAQTDQAIFLVPTIPVNLGSL
jgi:hypothetical protein